MDEPRENCVSRRSAILFAVLALWALAALVRGFWLAGPASGHYIREGEKQARSYGRIPAPRGRILDSRGVPLAWSERYFDLFWQGRVGEVPGEEVLSQLRAIVPDAAAPSAESNGRELLRRGLSPDQIRQLEVSLREKELAWCDILIGQGYAWEDTASVPRQKLEFARVKSGYASTLVQYEIAVRKLRKTRVEAPSSGFIYDLKLYPNDYAKTTEPCCVIVDTEWLDVVFYILERDLKELSVGERIAVTPAVDRGRAYEATITHILPIVDENGMIKVKARLTDPEGLWPGMSVMIHM